MENETSRRRLPEGGITGIRSILGEKDSAIIDIDPGQRACVSKTEDSITVSIDRFGFFSSFNLDPEGNLLGFYGLDAVTNFRYDYPVTEHDIPVLMEIINDCLRTK